MFSPPQSSSLSSPSSSRYLFLKAFETFLSASLLLPPGKCRCELYMKIFPHLEYFFMISPHSLPFFHLLNSPTRHAEKIKEKCELSFNNFDNSTFHHASCCCCCCCCQKGKHEQKQEQEEEEDKKRKKLIFSLTDKIQCFSL